MISNREALACRQQVKNNFYRASQLSNPKLKAAMIELAAVDHVALMKPHKAPAKAVSVEFNNEGRVW